MKTKWNRINDGVAMKSLVSFSGTCPCVSVNFNTDQVVYRADNGRATSEAVVLDGVNLGNINKAFLAINKTMPLALDRDWLRRCDK